MPYGIEDLFIPDEEGSSFGTWAPSSSQGGVTSGRTEKKKDEKLPESPVTQGTKGGALSAGTPSYYQGGGGGGGGGVTTAPTTRGAPTAATASVSPVTATPQGPAALQASSGSNVAATGGGITRSGMSKRENLPPPASFDRNQVMSILGETAGYGDAGTRQKEGPGFNEPATGGGAEATQGGVTGGGAPPSGPGMPKTPALPAGASLDAPPGVTGAPATSILGLMQAAAQQQPGKLAGAMAGQTQPRQAGLEGLPLTPHEIAQQGGMGRSEWRNTPMTLAERQKAGGKYGTDYYAAYTNSGDLAAVIPAVLSDQQRVRLVDPKTGEVMVEGVGEKGAQQIATLATQISKDGNRKAAWKIDYEDAPNSGSFVSPGYDKVDPKKNLLKTVVNIAAPLLGAAIPGLAPALGAALGGFGGSLATGGNLKSALLSAATAGVGNSLGGGLSSLLKGGGFTAGLGGTNALGGLLNAAGFGSGAAGNILGSNADILNTLSGRTLEGGGNLAGAIASNAANPAIAQYITDNFGADALQGLLVNAGSTGASLAPTLAGLGGAALPTALQQFGGAGVGTDLEGVDVMGEAGQGGFDPTQLAGLGINMPYQGAGMDVGTTPPSGDMGETPDETGGQEPQKEGGLMDELFSKDTAADIAGQTAGNVAGTYGVYTLADMLGFLGGDPNTQVKMNPTTGAPEIPWWLNPTPGGDTGTPTPPVANIGTPGGSTPGAGGGGSGALGQALALANTGAAGGAAAPLAPAPQLNGRGTQAPDIYPWRKRPGMG